MVMQDITPLKELDRLRTEWVATVSHDLKNPIAAVQLAAGLMDQAGPLTEMQREVLAKMLRSSERLRSLVTDVLDLARLEAGPAVRVGVIDLAAIIVETITAGLEEDEHEYEVIYAADGFEAGIQVSHFKPDLLILDIMMPDIDGYEVCLKLKSSEETKHIKIIVLSGYLDEESYKKMREYGADLCFSKPLPLDRLREEIARLLYPGEGGKAAGSSG